MRKTSNGVDGYASHEFPQGAYTQGVGPFTDLSFPLLMIPDMYYIESIQYLARIFNEYRLMIYILSDDKNVVGIMEKYKRMVKCSNVEFSCRTAENSHQINILEDFFLITQCDCLIRSESTFATAASKLGDYLIQISPVHYQYIDGHLIIDESRINVRKNPINKTARWVWPHSGSWCKCVALKS